jgi:hypothetical protein
VRVADGGDTDDSIGVYGWPPEIVFSVAEFCRCIHFVLQSADLWT